MKTEWDCPCCGVTLRKCEWCEKLYDAGNDLECTGLCPECQRRAKADGKDLAHQTRPDRVS